MKRAVDNDMGSLELLLDTMCNTFGCLIFISILLAILTQQIGQDIVKAMDPEKVVRDLREATIAVKELEGVIADLENTLASINATPPPTVSEADLSDALAEAKKAHAEAQEQSDQDKASEKEAQKKLEEAQGINHQLGQELANLEREKNKPIQLAVGLAPEHALGRRSAVMHFAFRGGKIYMVTKPPGNGGLNTDEVSVKQGGIRVGNATVQALQVSLKPDAGTVVSPTGPVPRKIRDALNEVPIDGFVMFHVDERSFRQFMLVRSALLERRGHPPYNWSPVDTRNPLLFQSSSEPIDVGTGMGGGQ